MLGKIKDIIKKRQEENKQREATSTGFKTVEDYNKWKAETRIKSREKIDHTLQKKRKQKLKDKIEKSESNRNKSTLQVYADVFDKVGKGVDKFQKGVEKFEKGIGQLEDGLSSSGKPQRKSKRKTSSNTTRTAYRNNPPKRRIRPKVTSGDDGFNWLESNISSKKSSRKKKSDDGFGWLEN